ncbi:MAG: response regulator [Magnetococcales bacterium]|nr:response regulator [Magnetococcales bacterium]
MDVDHANDAKGRRSSRQRLSGGFRGGAMIAGGVRLTMPRTRALRLAVWSALLGFWSALGVSLTEGRIEGPWLLLPLAVGALAVLGVLWGVQDSERRLVEAQRTREELEARIKEGQRAVEKAEKVRGRMIRDLSHEIRTPLNAILGMMELLAESRLDAEQRRYLSISADGGRAIQHLLDDFADLARSGKGKTALKRVVFDPPALLAGVSGLLEAAGREQGVVVSWSLDPVMPSRLVGDSGRLRQVLNHLGEQLLRWPWQEGVNRELTLQAQVAALDVQAAAITFAVLGTGLRQDLTLPADEGESSDEGVEAETPPLILAQRLADTMGGIVQVEREGDLAALLFTAPFQLDGGSAQSLECAGARALIADGDPRRRCETAEAMRQVGCTSVVEAEGGGQCVEVLRQGGMPVGVVVLHCRLPDGDGLTWAQALRRTDPAVPLLIQMSEGCAVDPEVFQALGNAAVLSDPVQVWDLARKAGDAMARAREIRAGGETPPSRPLEEGLPGEGEAAVDPTGEGRPIRERLRRILVVDDAEDNGLLVQAFLKEGPFRVDTAPDGRMALEKLRLNHYDLVLMDIQMPEMDGLEATRRFRRWERERGMPPTPVIALTVRAEPEDVASSLAAGCDLHLVKPIRKRLLVDAITAALHGADAAALAAAGERR